MAHLSISLLGTFSVTLDGQEARGFESDKARSLLAYLALEGVRPQRREALASLLWPEQPENRARASLNQSLYNLRSLLGDRNTDNPFLVSTPQTVQLNPLCDCRVDVRQLEELFSTCEQHQHAHLESCEACASRLAQVVTLYQGDFLQGFSPGGLLEFEEWALVIRERTRLDVIRALTGLAGYHEARGEIEQALVYAGRIVRLDPLWEAGQRGLMRALALSGQREAALEGYQKYRDRLWDELGVETEQETQALYERLRGESLQGPAIDNLPAHLTPFVGRQVELGELGAMLRDPRCRLVTLLGEGGSGKTRLALRVAEGLRYHFADGLYLVPLSALGSVESLIPTVAEALELVFREAGDPQAQLVDYLRSKKLLLVMDSFETVLGGAGWLSDLLRAAPGVKALVTSRARLNVKAEQLFPLSGMRYPEPDAIPQADFDLEQYSAMKLFLTSARRNDPHLEWDVDNWREVARLCRLVKGMPLGLLLSSAWVGTYTLSEIGDEIERSLDFLSADWGDVPQRQRSLRATLDYSWQLLNEDERKLLSQLSVFQGGFTRQAAVAVYGAYPLILQTLADKSMLEIRSAGRYGMHDLLRQYAAEKLAEDTQFEQEAQQAHAAHYLEALSDWGAGLRNARQVDVLQRMDVEHDDLRAAWEWAVAARRPDLFGPGLNGLCRYYQLRVRNAEGVSASRSAAQRLGEMDGPGYTHERIQAVLWQYDFYNALGNAQAVDQSLEESHRLLQAADSSLDLRREWSRYWSGHGWHLLYRDQVASREALERSLELSLTLDEPFEVASSLIDLGNWLRLNGDFPDAERIYRRSLETLTQGGAPSDKAAATRGLGYVTMRQGKFDEALRNMLEAAEFSRQLGDRHSQATALHAVGMIYVWLWRPDQARLHTKQSQMIYEQLGDSRQVNFERMMLAYLNLNSGSYAPAEDVLRNTASLGKQIGSDRISTISHMWLGQIALARRDYPQAERELQESITLSRGGASQDDMAFVLGVGGMSACFLGESARAVARIRRGLQISLETHGYGSLHHCLAAAALLFAVHGQAARAVELYALACRLPALNHTPWVEDAVGWCIQQAAESLAEDVRQRAEKHGQEADPFQVAQELLGWLEELAPISYEE